MLVMGLGNPGPGYADTRHNVGYLVTDNLMKEPPLRLHRRLFSSAMTVVSQDAENSRKIIIVRFSGFMNNSGVILPSLLKRYRISVSDLLVVVDNMDLPAGAARLRKGGGTAGHNGLKSIVGTLGESDFLRMYIGVGRPETGVSVIDHVLGVPDTNDSNAIFESCERSSAAIRRLTEESFDRVAGEFNRRGT